MPKSSREEKIDVDDFYKKRCCTCANEECARQAADSNWKDKREAVFEYCQKERLYKLKEKPVVK